MACQRGEAAPNSHTKLQLFADSGGYCQNPECNANLFLSVGESEFHIAEMAHIISAGSLGPRSGSGLTNLEKGGFSNLILLCPTCHTIIDKAQLEYPEDLIKSWKSSHSQRIGDLFNVKHQPTRESARKSILPFLNENKAVFELYGPLTSERFNPESRTPYLWLRKIQHVILPNNRKILKILDVNYSHLSETESPIVEIFRQHVLDFEARHLNGIELEAARFPNKLHDIFLTTHGE